MYSEGSTNTRTLEGTLHETISRLTECKQTAEVVRLVHHARRYVVILTSWEKAPPPPAEQNEIIDEVMQLLKQSMTLQVERASTPPPSKPAAKPASDRKPASDDGPEICIAESEPPSSSRPGTRPLARVPVEKKHGFTRPDGSMGLTPEANAPASDKPAQENLTAGPGTAVLRPYRQPWGAVPGILGVFVKRLHKDAARGPCQALVRLEAGAQLPSHRHGVAEDIYVLAGSLQVGSEEVHPGEIIHAEPGATSGPIRSPGECTVLLIGSDREDLLPKKR